MATLDVPNKYLASAPVIVTSPTPRCGTTLLQRLLTASDNAFIYGEEIGNHIKMLTHWFVAQMKIVETAGPGLDADFQRALDGTLSDWRPGLAPPGDILLKAWVETYYQIPATLTAYGQTIGRPIWGFKYPGLDRDNIRALLSLMPHSRVVYVVRNLYDVLKSAKARKFVTTNREVAAFCERWATNVTEIAAIASDQRILFVKYEDMLARRADYVALLEQFTGAKGVDARQFDLKVNTFKGEISAGHAPDQYIAPAELSKTDRGHVLNKARTAMEGLYGPLSEAA